MVRMGSGWRDRDTPTPAAFDVDTSAGAVLTADIACDCMLTAMKVRMRIGYEEGSLLSSLVCVSVNQCFPPYEPPRFCRLA